jgi:hypothetical protein
MIGSPKWSPFLRSPHQNPVCISLFPIRAICPAHLILLDLITRILFGDEYTSLSSFLCSLLHSPVASFPLGVILIHSYRNFIFWKSDKVNSLLICFYKGGIFSILRCR